MGQTASVVLAACLLAVIVASAGADPVQWAGNGHWYEGVIPPPYVTWEQADQAARARTWMGIPGHLATITSQEEQAFIGTLIVASQNYYVAGFQDPTSSPVANNWHWQTSETWSYTHWNSGEPNDQYGVGLESCLEVYGNSGYWNDSYCGVGMSYLVEYDGLVSLETSTWGSIKALFEL